MVVLNKERQLRTIRLDVFQQGLFDRCWVVSAATLTRLLDALYRYPGYGFDIRDREGLQYLDGNRSVVLRLGLFQLSSCLFETIRPKFSHLCFDSCLLVLFKLSGKACRRFADNYNRSWFNVVPARAVNLPTMPRADEDIYWDNKLVHWLLVHFRKVA